MASRRRKPRPARPAPEAPRSPTAPASRHVHTDADPFAPVLDKDPAARSPREIRESIEIDVALERRGEPNR